MSKPLLRCSAPTCKTKDGKGVELRLSMSLRTCTRWVCPKCLVERAVIYRAGMVNPTEVGRSKIKMYRRVHLRELERVRQRRNKRRRPE